MCCIMNFMSEDLPCVFVDLTIVPYSCVLLRSFVISGKRLGGDDASGHRKQSRQFRHPVYEDWRHESH